MTYDSGIGENSEKTTIITDEELEMMAEYARSSQTESTFLQKLNNNAKKEKDEVSSVRKFITF